MKPFEFYVPQHLIFGNGVFQQLATLPMPGKKALIVTTEERLFIDRTVELLAQNGVESAVYDQIRPNPNTENINNGAKFGVEHGCDFVVSVGGGSPVDASKCIAMLMYEGVENDIWDYVQYLPEHKTPKGCLPVIVVSTTAGTGSEVTPAGVVSNDNIDVKLDVAYPCMFPLYSIVDPEMHVSIPKFLTACQGMDVVFHCLEGYLDKLHTPYSDMVYLEGLRYSAANLATAYHCPEDLEARGAMALASNLAGMGESLVDVMSLHAMGHTLGSFHHELEHGVSLCMLAPEMFEFYCNYPTATRSRMATMAEITNHGHEPEGLVQFIVDVLKSVDLYAIDYKKYGIDKANCRMYAEHTIHQIAAYMDKDEYTPTVDDLEMLYRKAFDRLDSLLAQK